MPDRANWDWAAGERTLADLGQIRGALKAVHELVASSDGERIAAPVQKDDDVFGVCVNGEVWEADFEKAWHLAFAPDGRLTALVRIDDEWTVAVDGEPWEQRFEFAWNTKFSKDGSKIAAQIKQDMQYAIAVNGEPWEERFLSCRDYVLSADGHIAAALVQAEELAEADVFKFLEGTWSVAVNGKLWDRRFLNVYAPCFDDTAKHLAVAVRTSPTEYTVARDDDPWNEQFGCIWEPSCRPGTGAVVVPVRTEGGWTLVEDGNPLWRRRYMQLWRHRFSPDGKRIAAVAAAEYGRWTIAVDDAPWQVTWGDLVLPPMFSPDGKRVAAVVKDANRWTIAVDGAPWAEDFDMVWAPVFTPDGEHVLAKVEREGRYRVAVDGKLYKPVFDQLWEPVVSPDGAAVLLRCVVDDKIRRRVVPLGDVVR